MIDTHCHIYKDSFDDIDKVVNNMDGYMIVSGCDDDTNKEVLRLVSVYPNVYGTLGLHPTDLDKLTDKSFKIIEDNINNPKIVGIGEIGLDYHYENTDKELQQEIFIKQILLAKKYNKTVVIHSRDAIEDTYNILDKYIGNTKCILHCYGSSVEMAKKFLKFNIMFGIGGVVTFKNGKTLKEVVKEIDIKYLLLETDSPYLAPEPLRGTINEPKNVDLVASKIAEIKEINKEQVLEITTSNAISQFDLPI